MTIIVHGRARIRPDMLDTVLAAAALVGELSRAEAGCEEYRWSQDLVDPSHLILAEEWASEQDVQEHVASPAFAAFAHVLRDGLDGVPSFVRFTAGSATPMFG
jgi:quinol monooxygenase YgiN